MKECNDYLTQTNCEAAATRTENPQPCSWGAGGCSFQGGGGGGGCPYYDGTNQTACEVTSNSTFGLSCEWINNTGEELCNQPMKTCSSWNSQGDCMATYYCSWNGTGCNDPSTTPVFGSGNNPGCAVLGESADCNKTKYCIWSGGSCQSNGSMDASGLSCPMINDSTFCNAIPMLSNCCSWNSSSACGTNTQSTSCWEISAPPTGASFCEDYNAIHNQDICNNLSGAPWYMPCKWSNSTVKLTNGSNTGQCQANANAIFGAGGGNFFDIGSQSNCEQLGGVWKTESYIDFSGSIASDSWCEMAIGQQTQKDNCDTTCWACESKNSSGAQVTTLAEAQNACNNSLTDCEFHTDSNAFNSFGWCDFKSGMNFMGAGDCNNGCFNCVDNSSCSSSSANCTWFADSLGFGAGWCDPQAMKVFKDCNTNCQACMGSTACSASTKTGGCLFNTTYNVCMTNGTTEEVCFLPGDEDGNGAADCADANCNYDPSCGFGLGGDFGAGMAVFKEAMMNPEICFQHDGNGNEAACLAEQLGGKSICYSYADPDEGALCDPIFEQMMGGSNMGSNPPVHIGSDEINDTASLRNGSYSWLDIAEVGVHDNPDSYDFGIPVNNMTNFADCYKQYQAKGTNQTGKYYRFLDTDGNTTNGCNTTTDLGSLVTGFDYLMGFLAYMNGSNMLTENSTAYRCVEGAWLPFSAQLTPFKQPCSMPSFEINLPFNGVQVLLIKKQDIQYPKNDLRILVSTANGSNTSNYSNPFDTAGPFYYTPGAANFNFEDCFSPGQDLDGDGFTSEQDPDCKTVNKFGFVPLEGGPACTDGKDNDFNGLTDCSDPMCSYDPFFCGTYSFDSPNPNDHTAPQLKKQDVDKLVDSAMVTFKTNEPTNGTLIFYNASANCQGANSPIREDTSKNAMHSILISNSTVNQTLLPINAMTRNTTYYYKLKFCDPSSNCAESSCFNFTTAANFSTCTACSFTNKFTYYNTSSTSAATKELLISYDWNNDGTLDAQQSGGYAVNTNYTQTKNVTMQLGNPNVTTPWAIEFADSKFTGALTSAATNVTAAELTFNFTNASAVYVGMDADQYTAILEETHAKYIDLKIPAGNFTTLWHCEDDLSGCVNVTSNVTRLGSNGTWTEWRFSTNKLGLGMSVYGSSSYSAPAAAAAASSSSTSSSGGGGAGTDTTSISNSYSLIPPNVEKVVDASAKNYGVQKITFQTKQEASNVKIILKGLSAKPSAITEETEGTVFKYFEIETTNLPNTNIKEAKISFYAEKSWLTTNGYTKNDIKLFRHTTSWEELQVSSVGEDSTKYYFDAPTPGFSTFAITAVKIVEKAPTKEATKEEAPTTPAVITPKAAPKPTKTALIASLIILIVIILIGAVYLFTKKKEGQRLKKK